MKFLAIGLVLVVAFALIMSLFQNRIIFPTHMVPRPGPLPANTQRLSIDTPDGYRLHGVHIPPAGAERRERTLILGFAGNAWNSADAATYLHQLYPDAHVVTLHYRGYAPSTGSPFAAALLEDAPLVFDAAVQRVQPRRTIAVGFSIGSAVAARAANRRPLDGVILVTPFDSLRAVAREHYPWAPVSLLFREEMNTASELEEMDVPVAIIAGERDALIPPRRTAALRSRLRNLVFERTIPGAGHNDIYERPEFRQAMSEAYRAIGG